MCNRKGGDRYIGFSKSDPATKLDRLDSLGVEDPEAVELNPTTNLNNIAFVLKWAIKTRI